MSLLCGRCWAIRTTFSRGIASINYKNASARSIGTLRAGLFPNFASAIRFAQITLTTNTAARRTLASTSAKSTSWFSAPSSLFWQRLARLVRIVRIPVLVVSVYSLGFQQGVMDCTKTPDALSEKILLSVLVATGTQDLENDVHIVHEKEISIFSRSKPHQVAAVGHRIINAARVYVNEQLQAAMNDVTAVLPADIDAKYAREAMERDETVQFWLDARLRIEGEGIISKPWQYIFIRSPNPNAFVSEILPHRFFITEALLEIATTPDELAVILGHEISHLLLGHVSRTNQVETFLRTAEVLLLSIDPTQGVLALGVIALLAFLRSLLTAAHSRENEREADDIGLRLAARACFDTVKGVEVMRKLHQHSVATNSTVHPSTLLQLMDTHPPSYERYLQMQALSQTHNPTKYRQSYCPTVGSRLYGAVWGFDESETEATKAVKTTKGAPVKLSADLQNYLSNGGKK
jgi:Zn-dependent protease with chaperone function